LGYYWAMGVSIKIKAWALEIELASNDNYPDQLDDLVNRALIAFKNSVSVLQDTKVPLFDPELPDMDEE
jgi:hypothetical protein